MVTPLAAYSTESFTFFASLGRRAQRVGIFQYRASLVWVLKKKGGQHRDSGWVEVLKYLIRYFWVPFLLSCNSRYVRYSRVPWVFRVYWVYLNYWVKPNISSCLIPYHFQNWIVSCRVSEKCRVLDTLQAMLMKGHIFGHRSSPNCFLCLVTSHLLAAFSSLSKLIQLLLASGLLLLHLEPL